MRNLEDHEENTSVEPERYADLVTLFEAAKKKVFGEEKRRASGIMSVPAGMQGKRGVR